MPRNPFRPFLTNRKRDPRRVWPCKACGYSPNYTLACQNCGRDFWGKFVGFVPEGERDNRPGLRSDSSR